MKIEDQENTLDEETEKSIVMHLNLIDQNRYRQIVKNLRKIKDIKVKYEQIHQDIARSGIETLKNYQQDNEEADKCLKRMIQEETVLPIKEMKKIQKKLNKIRNLKHEDNRISVEGPILEMIGDTVQEE